MKKISNKVRKEMKKSEGTGKAEQGKDSRKRKAKAEKESRVDKGGNTLVMMIRKCARGSRRITTI
jgi:hypothetical protein